MLLHILHGSPVSLTVCMFRHAIGTFSGVIKMIDSGSSARGSTAWQFAGEHSAPSAYSIQHVSFPSFVFLSLRLPGPLCVSLCPTSCIASASLKKKAIAVVTLHFISEVLSQTSHKIIKHLIFSLCCFWVGFPNVVSGNWFPTKKKSGWFYIFCFVFYSILS